MNFPTNPFDLAVLKSIQDVLSQVTAKPRLNTPPLCRPYIKWPAPTGLRPRATQAWKIADLCAAYNFPTNLPGGGVIGILEMGGGWSQNDLNMFSQLNGMPTIQITDVPVNGGAPQPVGTNTDADGEVALDIEVAAAAYFYATGQVPKINVFWAPNDFTSFALVFKAATDAGCDVLSISWGADENKWDQTPGAEQQLELDAAATTAKGCVLFASAGDNSSGDGDPGANVDVPSACPHVIGCGGTTKTRTSEVVWGDGTSSGEGTGGGYSDRFPAQSWQLNAPSGPGRMVPDVAANADPNTGYLVVVNGQETQIGGTSAVAPFYAGLFASFGRQLGFVTPTLWENPSAFTDITQGTNGSYRAAIGPDPCTGLGVPIGVKIAALFSGGAPPIVAPQATTVAAKKEQSLVVSVSSVVRLTSERDFQLT